MKWLDWLAGRTPEQRGAAQKEFSMPDNGTPDPKPFVDVYDVLGAIDHMRGATMTKDGWILGRSPLSLPPSSLPPIPSPPPGWVTNAMLGAQMPPPSCYVSKYVAQGVNIQDPVGLLMMRLRKDDIPESLFKYLNIVIMPTKTFVSLYKNDEMTTLEDDTAMFPSDKLVTAFRLLLG